MHQIITKSLLLLTIVLVIVAVATPNWTVYAESTSETSESLTSGLFKICHNIENDDDGIDYCHTLPPNGSLKACQGLGIAAVCFLFVALGCEFGCEFVEGNKSCRMIGMVSYVVGLILMIACISLYAAKIQESGTYYGYSFNLAIGAVVAGVLAGVSTVLSGSYGPHGHLRPGLRPPRLHRQTVA